MIIISSIRWVDEVFLSVDQDKSVCKSLEIIKPNIFANGGDRLNKEIPEASTCEEHNISLIDGIGKKIRSSSELTGFKPI